MSPDYNVRVHASKVTLGYKSNRESIKRSLRALRQAQYRLLRSNLLFYCHREGQSPVAISFIQMSFGILRQVEGDEVISYTHKELGYLNEKNKDEVHDQGSDKDNLKNSEEEEK
jgi:hypothetical protein